MTLTTTGTPRTYRRRTLLALSATGAAAAVLAACGETIAPTTTPAPTVAATAIKTAGPATAVPASLGATTAPPAATAGTMATAPAAMTTAAPAAMATTAASGSTVAGAAATKPANLADKQVFRWAYLEPTSYDPAVPQDPHTLTQIYEGLITLNQKDGSFDAAMAESYSSNADATLWTFKMRPNMKWSDGTPITAKDFEYSWKRIPDPKTMSIYTPSILPIKNGAETAAGKLPPDMLGVKATDDRTLEVQMSAPTPFFPLLASTWSFLPVPRHVVEKSDKWFEPPQSVSNGPYILKEWKHDQRMVFEANPNYWGAKPVVQRVEMTIYDDPVAKSLAAYEAGEIDSASVPQSEYDRVRNDPKLSKDLKGYAGSSTQMLHLDCTNKPTDDVRVRQALHLGFDRKTLIDKVLKGYYLDAPTIVTPDIAGYNEAAALTGGIEKAKQLLADAGFAGGAGFPTNFTIVYSTSAITKLVAEFMQEQWKQNLGIQAQVQVLEAKAYVQWRSERKTTPFNGHLGVWGSDYGDPFNWHNFLFTSSADFYKTHWKNDEYDGIVEKAKGMIDIDARTKEYQKAEVILVRESAHIPIYHGQSFYVAKPNVQGIYHRPILGTIPWYKYISITK